MTHPYSRRSFLEASLITGAAVHLSSGAPLLAGVARSGGFDSASESATAPRPAFPVADYHVHLSNTLSIDQALQLGKERGVQIGIVEHPGPGFPLNTDADLKKYIDGLRKYPVRIGVQPVYAGWSKSFSKPVLDQLDYILMDALTLPKPDGGLARDLADRHHGRRRRRIHDALHAIHRAAPDHRAPRHLRMAHVPPRPHRAPVRAALDEASESTASSTWPTPERSRSRSTS